MSEKTDEILEQLKTLTLLEASELRLTAGATSPHKQVIVLRTLSPLTEPAVLLLRQVWAAWRREMWGLPGAVPRLWNL